MNQEEIVEYLALKTRPEDRTQVALLRHFGVSQATLVVRLAELKGKGIVTERKIGTSVVYDIGSLSSAAQYGYVKEIGSEMVGDFLATLYLFGNTTCLEIVHKSGGLSFRIPIYNKELKDFIELIKGLKDLEKVVQSM